MELPLDIWAQILNVLTVRDLCRIEGTCKFMKEFCWKIQNKIDFQHSKYTTILRPATLHKILTSSSNISSLFFASDFSYLSDEDIEKITKLTRLQHLKLPNIKNCQIFTNLINHFSHLQSLTLSSYTTESQLITISQLTRLKSLCLAFMKKIPGNSFYHLTTLQRLTRLVLIGFKDLDDSTMKYISAFTNLIYLNLAFGDFSDKGMKSLIPLTKLQNLNLRYCDRIEKFALTSIVQLTQLTRLELADCRRLDEESLNLISHCTQLVALSFGNWFSTLSNNGLNWIINNWPNLKKLNLVGTTSITDASFSRLCLLPSLIVLKIGKNQHTTANWMTSLTTLKHITHLECINMPQFADSHFHTIVQLTTLRSLNLVEVAVTAEGFQEITQLIDLHYLTVMECSNLSYSSQLTPLSKLTTLRVLHLIKMTVEDDILTTLWPLTCIAQLCILSKVPLSQSVQKEVRLRLRRGVAMFKTDSY